MTFPRVPETHFGISDGNIPNYQIWEIYDGTLTAIHNVYIPSELDAREFGLYFFVFETNDSMFYENSRKPWKCRKNPSPNESTNEYKYLKKITGCQSMEWFDWYARNCMIMEKYDWEFCDDTHGFKIPKEVKPNFVCWYSWGIDAKGRSINDGKLVSFMIKK
jgi:hypothetical protein